MRYVNYAGDVRLLIKGISAEHLTRLSITPSLTVHPSRQSRAFDCLLPVLARIITAPTSLVSCAPKTDT